MCDASELFVDSEEMEDENKVEVDDGVDPRRRVRGRRFSSDVQRNVISNV